MAIVSLAHYLYVKQRVAVKFLSRWDLVSGELCRCGWNLFINLIKHIVMLNFIPLSLSLVCSTDNNDCRKVAANFLSVCCAEKDFSHFCAQ